MNPTIGILAGLGIGVLIGMFVPIGIAIIISVGFILIALLPMTKMYSVPALAGLLGIIGISIVKMYVWNASAGLV